MRRKGLICVFTGNGKGKTSAALGTALRAAGQGLKVLILQFMKMQPNSGELKAIESFHLPIRLELKRLLDQKPPELHVILTGRSARPELLDMADLVTDMQEVKHPYRAGVRAQAGIEY